MKAIVQDRYGPADVLELRDVDRPAIGERDVLVQVHAAGVDPGVWHEMTGEPYLIRAISGFRRPRKRIRGWDVAGTVAGVGGQVARFTPGDEVFGTCVGAFAEYAVAREDRLVPKPPETGFAEAAAVPTSGMTALQAVREKGRLRPGQRVLVLGAGGGVGTFTVQLARVLGAASVTGVSSGSKVDLVRVLGAEEAIDYARADVTEGTGRFDLIVDTAGNRPLSRLRRILTPTGTLVIVGGEGGGHLLGAGLKRNLAAAARTPFLRQRLVGMVSLPNLDSLENLRGMLVDGSIAPVIDRTFTLREVPEAVRYLQQGQTRGGKVVILVRDDAAG